MTRKIEKLSHKTKVKLQKDLYICDWNTRVGKNNNTGIYLLARRAIGIPNAGLGIFREKQNEEGNGNRTGALYVSSLELSSGKRRDAGLNPAGVDFFFSKNLVFSFV